MKVCIIAEGCYPYVVGGVSSWIHSMIRSFPGVEFSLVAVVADRKVRGKFLYELPENLTSVTEVYLQDTDWNLRKTRGSYPRLHLKSREWEALRTLILKEAPDWDQVFRLFWNGKFSIDRLLMSYEFYRIVREYYQKRYPTLAFTDFLWTMRSVYLSLFVAMQCKPPEADVYHCIATGYSGVIGSLAKAARPHKAMLVSEHGIYTREREEEIIKAKWVKGIYKDIWIEQFRKMSRCAYAHADRVTSLFAQAREMQAELGCPRDKLAVTPNGIDVQAFEGIPQKAADDPYVNVGAFVRVAPIKDVKTMINAFFYAHKQNPALKLWIMGPLEDETYVEECRQLIGALHAENIVFTGSIQTAEHIGKMDMTLLTSISEGQPLTILESYAARRPAIATNVGNCAGLIYGEGDDFGAAGIVAPVLNVTQISEAILKLAADPELRRRMGEAGYRRLLSRYRLQDMIGAYNSIYGKLARIGAGALEGR
jgi:polysaccharide biosynthesis protein PelF